MFLKSLERDSFLTCDSPQTCFCLDMEVPKHVFISTKTHTADAVNGIIDTTPFSRF